MPKYYISFITKADANTKLDDEVAEGIAAIKKVNF
jgi:hypothetical protein